MRFVFKKCFLNTISCALFMLLNVILPFLSTGEAQAESAHTETAQTETEPRIIRQQGSLFQRVTNGASKKVPQYGEIARPQTNRPQLSRVPDLGSLVPGTNMIRTSKGDQLTLTIDTKLQSQAEDIFRRGNPPYAAVVLMKPDSGKVLAIAGSSRYGIPNEIMPIRATFPAASLFKVITASAAIEERGLNGNTLVAFRGGDHELGVENYLPNVRQDRRIMTLEDAIGKSCNAVFARIAINHLTPTILQKYAERYGFNSPLPFSVSPQQSTFEVDDDSYDYARTAAGFGRALLSPVHAASIMSAIANSGLMMEPYLIDSIQNPKGEIIYQAKAQALRRTTSPETAAELLLMMRATAETGTGRRVFSSGTRAGSLRSIEVTGKTGTLKGNDPQGLYHWFIGAAPASNPEIVVSALVIDRGGSNLRATTLAGRMLESYFALKNGDSLPSAVFATAPMGKGRVRSKKSLKSSTISAKKKSTAKKSKYRSIRPVAKKAVTKKVVTKQTRSRK
jgi:penicillin-binding protein A